MATLNLLQSQRAHSGPNLDNNFGSESAEIHSLNTIDAQKLAEEKARNNSVWTNLLTGSSENNSNISFTRLDSSQSPPRETQKISFEDHFNKINYENSNESPNKEQIPVARLEGSIKFQPQKLETAEPGMEQSETGEKKNTDTEKSLKKSAYSSAEKTAEISGKVAKRGFKEGKEVFNAVKDLLTNFIFYKEKKADPKAKENAEKLAKRRANKSRFMQTLREGMSIYYSEMRKMIIELEAKLGVNGLRAEDKNQLLGRNRNISFQGNDSIYAIHQTAFAMVEQKKRQQQQSSGSAAPRGKPSRGQIFTDKTLQGERSGGNNMMSAVG